MPQLRLAPGPVFQATVRVGAVIAAFQGYAWFMGFDDDIHAWMAHHRVYASLGLLTVWLLNWIALDAQASARAAAGRKRRVP